MTRELDQGKSLTNDTFIERYSWMFEKSPLPLGAVSVIKLIEIPTPLGPMVAGATSKGLCLLEFANRIRFEKEITDLKKLLNAAIFPGRNQHLDQLEIELREYFAGSRKTFSIPLDLPGNAFAQAVWQQLRTIPYGRTCSYKQQAEMMQNPKAIRAIASANGRNRLAIIIPCHRVIGSDGSLTGYAAGVDKKRWLLQFERNNSGVEEGYLWLYMEYSG